MLETALELSHGEAVRPALTKTSAKVLAKVLAEFMFAGSELMLHPTEALPVGPETLEHLSRVAPLVLVTQGDLFHPEGKLAASGLDRVFSDVDLVSEKTADTCRRAFRRHGAAPETALMMAGNSVRSDILPAVNAGSHAALIPDPLVQAHEAADAPQDHPHFTQFDSLGGRASWLQAAGR